LYDAETKWEVRERERRRGGGIHTYTDIMGVSGKRRSRRLGLNRTRELCTADTETDTD
jgi:hypothetical protein